MTERPSVTAVIPVKPLERALGRLASVLSGPARRDLQWEMLGSVLGACVDAEGIERIIVVSADPHVRGLAHAFGARVLVDHHPPRGMNAAVALGCEAARLAGADAALVLTADLPLARATDLDSVIGGGQVAAGVVCVPSRDGTGTNAMLLRGPRVIDPQLGPESFVRHRRQARRRGVPFACRPVEGLALDIDTSDDLAALADLDAAWGDIVVSFGAPALEGVR
jgi:2-phospho-L-lactate/phosphoenolpyruvate guanylyltransferase